MNVSLQNKRLLGINGIGRIGKLTLWNHLNLKHFDGIVINAGREVGKKTRDIIHYLTTDSTYGSIDRFLFGYTGKICEIKVLDEEKCVLEMNGMTVKILKKERNPRSIDWAKEGVRLVVDCTGVFLDPTQPADHPKGSIRGHIEAGAEKVITSAPFKIKDSSQKMPDDSALFVYGVNHASYDPAKHHLLSAASCTTTGLAHMIKPLLDTEETSKIITASMSTVHSATNNQNILDAPPVAGSSDLRRNRSVFIASHNPAMVETFYSRAIYPHIGRMLSIVTGILPFSIAEITVIFVPVAFIVYTAVTLIKSFYHRSFNFMWLLRYVINILVILSIVFFTFIGIWGLNYYRMPFSSIAGFEVKPASIEELEGLCRTLIVKANTLRESVSVNSEGNVDIPGSSRDILQNCYKGYAEIASRYPQLAGKYGNPKPVFLSELMNYTGICGMYFPFTAEANVNVSIPESTLPSTASHEMAHQRGFSREDEANYIAYLACSNHPDINYRYSGIFLALVHSMNALHGSDEALASELTESYSEAVRKDLLEVKEFWKKYEGPVEEATNRMNDTYLKANNQKDGVRSYGRMVDLLIAEYKEADK